MKTWVYPVVVLIVGLLVYAAGALSVSCTAPVNVNVKAEQWKCEIQQTGADGSVEFKGCTKVDGDAPVNQDSTDAPESIEGSLSPDFNVRWN